MTAKPKPCDQTKAQTTMDSFSAHRAARIIQHSLSRLNVGAGALGFLWRLRHNTGLFSNIPPHPVRSRSLSGHAYSYPWDLAPPRLASHWSTKSPAAPQESPRTPGEQTARISHACKAHVSVAFFRQVPDAVVADYALTQLNQ